MQELQNHPLYKRFEEKFTRTSPEEKSLERDALDYFKNLLSKELDYGKFKYDILGVNIDNTEPQLLKKIPKSTINVPSLFSWLLMNEKDIPDMHRFLLALYHLYIEITEEKEEIDESECGAVIAFASALFENTVKKAYWIQKGNYDEHDVITLHPLIQKIFRFGASKGSRKGKQLKDWQISVVWAYELRNSFAHELHSLPLEQFKLVYHSTVLSLVYAMAQIIDHNGSWFMNCPSKDDSTWLTIKWKSPGSSIWCPQCGNDITVK